MGKRRCCESSPDTAKPTSEGAHSSSSLSRFRHSDYISDDEAIELADDGELEECFQASFRSFETLKKVYEEYVQFAHDLEAQLSASKEKITVLETAVNESKNMTDALIAERDSYKNALKLAKAEIDTLRGAFGSSPKSEMRNIQGSLHECYSRCFEENKLLRMQLRIQGIELESFKNQNNLEQKKLKDENVETMVGEMGVKLDIMTTQLEEKTDDMQYMESLNQVLVLKERVSNDELQQARRVLISGLQDFRGDQTRIGIKRMGELNPQPFRDACMQRFPEDWEDWDIQSAELCSFWQEKIKNPQWLPFKPIKKTNGTFDEVIDEDDDELKRLKGDWGERVHKAVCEALSEINEYNPSTRYSVPELWSFREARKAHLGEVIDYLLKRLKVSVRRTRR